MTTLTDINAQAQVKKTANVLRAKQEARLEIMYGIAVGNKICARLDYERTKQWANMVGLGDKLHCNVIDPDFFSLFSDWYKDENGFRPRGENWTFKRCSDHWAAHAEQQAAA
jgi:hypothetical protein